MSVPERIDLNESDLDDALLVERIRNVTMGALHPDPEGETLEEQSTLILKTIARQLRSDNPSRAALGYLAHCLERSLDNSTESLDEAFYAKHHKLAGGQPVKSKVERDAVKAYMSIIRRATWKIDPITEEPIYEYPSKAVLREAEQAAFKAYRNATGKDDDSFNDPDKKIRQTIKPLLKRLGILR